VLEIRIGSTLSNQSLHDAQIAEETSPELQKETKRLITMTLFCTI